MKKRWSDFEVAFAVLLQSIFGVVFICCIASVCVVGDDNPPFRIKTLGGGPPHHISKVRENAYKAFMKKMTDHSWRTTNYWSSLEASIDLAWEASMDVLDASVVKEDRDKIAVGSQCFTKVGEKALPVVVLQGPSSDGTYLVKETGLEADRFFRRPDELYFPESPKAKSITPEK